MGQLHQGHEGKPGVKTTVKEQPGKDRRSALAISLRFLENARMYMHRPFAVVTTLVLAIFFTWAIADAQTGTEDKGDTKKAKGTLPAGWKKLDLTAQQNDAIYTVMGTYKTKI